MNRLRGLSRSTNDGRQFGPIRRLPLIKHVSETGNARWTWSLILLFLLGLAIRFWQIDYHSLWFDETMSVFWARQSLREITDVGLHLVKDKHPPVYYLLLHLWINIFGDGTVAVRSLSILFGAFLPPLLASLGAELADRRAGAIAGLLAALSPILVWYSQEARMFMPATTFAVATAWCLVRMLRRFEWHWWFIYLLFSSAGFYTYLFYTLVIIFQTVFALVWIIIESRGPQKISWGYLLRIASVFVVLALLCAPLAVQAFHVSTAEAPAGQPFDHAFPTMWNLLKAFTIRRVPWPAPLATTVYLIAVVLLIAGLVVPPIRKRILVWCWLAVPLVVGNLMLGINEDVFSEIRYFLFLAPALCLAWGNGFAWLSRRRPAIGSVALAAWAIVLLLALPGNWQPENRREDWRGAAEYVLAHAGPDDAVLIHPAFVRVAFGYYAQNRLPLFFPFTGDVESTEQITPPLQGLTSYATIWLVASHDTEPDPQHLVQRWFEDRFPIVTEQFPSGISIRGYATQYRLSALPAGVQPTSIRYAEGLQLAGQTVDQTTLSAMDDQYHPPSNWIHATLYWTTDVPLVDDLAIRLTLVDEWGQIWGDRLYRAGETLNHHPSTQWIPGEVIRTDFDVNLNPVTPAGSYKLDLAVLAEDDQAWPLLEPAFDGAHLSLAEIHIIKE